MRINALIKNLDILVKIGRDIELALIKGNPKLANDLEMIAEDIKVTIRRELINLFREGEKEILMPHSFIQLIVLLYRKKNRVDSMWRADRKYLIQLPTKWL